MIIDYYNNNKNKSLLMIHCLFFFITACCFSYFDYFLLSDYPNYLARINLYNHFSDTHILSEYYYKNMQISPYMGFPVIVGFLESIIGIYWAGKIFIIFALSVIVSSGIFLNYTLYNRITPFSLFIHIFMFNYTLSMGFMNFTLGLGLVLWGYGLWIRCYHHHIKFYVLFALYGIIVFFCHVFALFLLGLLIGLYHISLSEKTTAQELLKASFYASIKILSFTIIPMIITIIISTLKENPIGFPIVTAYHDDLITNFTVSYITPLVFQLNHVYAVFCITLFMILIVLKKIELKQPFVLGILFAFGMCVPFYVAGVACVNERIPALLGLLFAVSATFKGENKHIAFLSVLTGILSIFIYINNINLLYTHNIWVSEFVNTIKDDKNLHGQRLLTVNDNDDVHYHNLSNYATIEANMFDPELMTYIPPIAMYKKYAKIYGCQQGAILSKELRLSDTKAQKYIQSQQETTKDDLSTKSGICPNNFYWRHWRNDFDYVFWIHPKKKPKNIPTELSVYKQGSFFTLYKIDLR